MNDHHLARPGWQPAQATPLGLGEEDPHRRGFDAAPAGGARELLQPLRQSLRGLALWVAACLGLAGLYLHEAAPEYVATTQVVLEPRRPMSGLPDTASGNYGTVLDSAQTDSQIQVVKSERTLRFVFDTLDLGTDPAFAREEAGLVGRVMGLLPLPHGDAERASPERQAATTRARAFQAFADRISVRRIGQSYVLEISFRAPDPAQAARLANAVTAAYIRDDIAYGAAAAQRGAEFLKGRIADIQTEQDVALAAVRKGVMPDAPFPDSDVRLVSGALEPLGKAYPQSKLILLLAASFGLLSGAGVVVARHKLDRTVRSRQQIGRLLGVDALNVVPRFHRATGSRFGRRELSFTSVIEADASAFAEALRVLRTAVLSSKKASRQIAIGVVSWSSGEGRSSIASNLALLVAASRERVVLIDADFRNPALSRFLAPDAAVGLDEALLTHLAAADHLAIPLNPSLDFVPAVAGGRTSDPNVFIGSAEMARLLRAFHEQQDIIVDLPPMSLSSDTLAIAHLLDGVVLVVEADRTSLDDLHEAFRSLQGAEVPILRIVLNKVPLRRADAKAARGSA